MRSLVAMEVFEQKILLIREKKVMLSPHLAELYAEGSDPPSVFGVVSHFVIPAIPPRQQ